MWVRDLTLAACLVPIPVAAACNDGAAPSYEDITYVSVTQYSLVKPLYPRFRYEARLTPRSAEPGRRAMATLNATRSVKLIGNFVAVDPQRAFRDVVATLERDRFFELRLRPAPPNIGYIDGPEDAITVVRCGVTTTLGTIASGGQVQLDDAQGNAFRSLEGDLRATIFSEGWVTPTPAPK